MPSATQTPARGKITAIQDGLVTFNPANTNYELRLRVAPGFTAPLNTPVDVVIRVKARKVWTVPSGGAFISPIAGPPKTIQGRLRQASDTELVIHAGTTIVATLHPTDTAVELPDGPMSALNNLVNVTAYPGGTLELVAAV